MTHEFCDHCDGCRPGMIGFDGKVLPESDPLMMKISAVWRNKTTYAQRKAFIDVTLHNRHTPENLAHMDVLIKLFQEEKI